MGEVLELDRRPVAVPIIHRPPIPAKTGAGRRGDRSRRRPSSQQPSVESLQEAIQHLKLEMQVHAGVTSGLGRARHPLIRLPALTQRLTSENQMLKAKALRTERELRSKTLEVGSVLRDAAVERITDAGLAHKVAESALVGKLRAKVQELSAALRGREDEITELRKGSKHARVVELETERNVYLNETQRLQLLVEQGAVDLEANRKLWRREHEEDLRRRGAEMKRAQDKILDMQQVRVRSADG